MCISLTIGQWLNAAVAVGTICMAIGTLILAYYTRKATHTSIKDRKRPFMVERIQYIITPFIKHLDKEIYSLDRILKSGGISRGVLSELVLSKLNLDINEKERIIFNDFKRDSPKITEKIEGHDTLFKILEEKVEKLEEATNTPGFREKCHKLTAEFNSKRPVGKKLSEDLIENASKNLIGPMLSNEKKIGGANAYDDFWEEFGEKILEIRNTEPVKNKIRETLNLSKRYIEQTQDLRSNLYSLREKYRKKYDILVEEFIASKPEFGFHGD